MRERAYSGDEVSCKAYQPALPITLRGVVLAYGRHDVRKCSRTEGYIVRFFACSNAPFVNRSCAAGRVPLAAMRRVPTSHARRRAWRRARR